MGGKKYDNGFKYLDTVVVFDIKTTSWTKQYTMNTPRCDAAAILYDNHICIIGGQSSAYPNDSTFESSVEVWSEGEEKVMIIKYLVLAIPTALFRIIKTNKNQLLAIGGQSKYAESSGHTYKFECKGSSLLQRIDSNTM